MSAKKAPTRKSKSSLTAEDRLVIAWLITEEIFEGINAHKLPNPAQRNTTLIACSDCHQIDHLLRTHRKGCGCRRHQPLLCNGGAFWLSPELKGKEASSKRYSLTADIKGTWGIKQLQTVALYIHAPCGAAANRKLTFREQLCHAIEGKAHLKKALHETGIRFVCFVHIDFGDGKKETFYVNVKRWRELQSELEAYLRQAQ